MPDSRYARPRRSLLSRFGRISSAFAVVATLLVAAPSAAWAGPRHHAPKAHVSSTTGTSTIINHSTGNPNYGWVIPITFVYAPGFGPS